MINKPVALAVETWGSAVSRVVLVHGSLSAGLAAFSEQKPLALSRQLVIPDRRGYGESPAAERVDIRRDAADILPLLQDKAHLVGTSMGAVVAMHVAALAPEAITSLTLIEPPAFGLARDIAEVGSVAAALERHWAAADPQDPRAFLAGFLEAVGLNMPLPPELPPPMLQAVRNLMTEAPWRVDVPVGAVADGAFPKMLVSGGWSPAFEGIADRLAGLLEAERHVLSGAFHSVQRLGQPFNEILSAFLDRAEA